MAVARSAARRRVGVAGFLAVCAAAFIPVHTGADAAGLVELARFDPAGPGNRVEQFASRLFIDHRSRRLLSIFSGRVRGKDAGYAVQLFDADSLEALGRALVIPGAERRYANIEPGALDMGHRRLFVADSLPVAGSARQVWRDGIAAIDYSGFNPKLLAQYDLTASLGPGVAVMAVSYFAPRDRLYVLSVVPTGQAGFNVPQTVAVSEFDASRVARGDPALVWTLRLPLCSDVMAWNQAPEFGRSLLRPAIFLGCRQAGYIFPFGPGQPGIVRIDLVPGTTASDTSGFRVTLFPLSGDHIQSDAWFDPNRDRMIVGGQSNVSNIGALWAFDGRTGRWAGSIGVGIAFLGGALDPTTGRLYIQPLDDPLPPFTGFTMAEIRPTPVRQGVSFPRYHMTTGLSRVGVDPGARRIFLERPLSQKQDSYLVLHDEVPPYEPPAPEDPDAQTTDQPEQPGVTSATFSGGGSGYAIRSLTVRGIHGALGNVLGPFVGLFNVVPDFPARGTRDVYVGVVRGAGINTSEAAAEAIAADRDPLNTGGDLARGPAAVRTATGQSAPEALYWPFPLAHCSGERTRRVEELGAVAACDFPKGAASATSTVGEHDIGAIRVTSGRTQVTVRRDAKRGVVTEVASKVEGIVVGEQVRIGSVETVAATWARGRRGTAGSAFARRIADVRMGDAELCRGVCPDPGPVFREIFERSNGRIDISMPHADPRLRGTRGGAEALVHRSLPEVVEDAQINESPGNRVEVPGLVVTVLNDGVHRSRQRFELAAVAAESHYFIFLLAQPQPLSGEAPVVAVSAAPSIADEGVTSLAPGPTVGGMTDVPAAPALYVVRRGGWTLALNTPGAGALAGVVFGLFAVPVYLAARRRLLVDALRSRRHGIEDT